MKRFVFCVVLGCGVFFSCQSEKKDGSSAEFESAEVMREGDELSELDGLNEMVDWNELIPEKGMGKWKAVDYGVDGMVHVEEGVLTMELGAELTGAKWTGDLPVVPYLVELEVRRVFGNDFFCGLSFPVRSEKEAVTLIVGGWGGGLVGISSIDGVDAANNETGRDMEFQTGQWYRVRVQVEEDRLRVWIDDAVVVDVDTTGRELGLRMGPIEDAAPFGIATWQTQAEVRHFRWRSLENTGDELD